MSEPRRPTKGSPRPAAEDDDQDGAQLALDDEVTLPALDGDASESGADDAAGAPGIDGAVEREDVGLDDATAEDAAEAMIEPLADVEAEGWETAEEDPLDEDDALATEDEQGWAEGAEQDDSTPVEIDAPEEPRGGVDDGEEGLEDDGKPRGDLELPPLRRDGDADEEYPDESEI